MSLHLAELYTPKPAWLALSPDARAAYFERVGAGMEALTALGVEPVAFGAVKADTLHAAPQTFFALWRFPDEAALDALLGGIAATGWHDYFQTINAAGQDVGFATHLGQLLAA